VPGMRTSARQHSDPRCAIEPSVLKHARLRAALATAPGAFPPSRECDRAELAVCRTTCSARQQRPDESPALLESRCSIYNVAAATLFAFLRALRTTRFATAAFARAVLTIARFVARFALRTLLLALRTLLLALRTDALAVAISFSVNKDLPEIFLTAGRSCRSGRSGLRRGKRTDALHRTPLGVFAAARGYIREVLTRSRPPTRHRQREHPPSHPFGIDGQPACDRLASWPESAIRAPRSRLARRSGSTPRIPGRTACRGFESLHPLSTEIPPYLSAVASVSYQAVASNYPDVTSRPGPTSEDSFS
jgi:hypothetical protein